MQTKNEGNEYLAEVYLVEATESNLGGRLIERPAPCQLNHLDTPTVSVLYFMIHYFVFANIFNKMVSAHKNTNIDTNHCLIFMASRDD